ncbi:MAG: pitrilysin family protein [Desulfobaccales bacterium]
MYRKSVLTNGLRVVSEELPHFHSVAVGVWLNAGSRDETLEENGLSHFLEHMAFKGTPSRTALEIAREIDQIGGSCNAFTSKEQTCFHGRVLAEHLDRLVDLLGDLFLNPLYSSQDLDRERQVILEEICAQDDNPEDQVQIAFSRHFWGDTPLGRPILGEAGHIAGVNREELLAYRQASYRPEETVVAAAGRVRHEDLENLVARHFEKFANGHPVRSRSAASHHPGVNAVHRDLEQVYLCFGTQGVAAGDSRRFAATLLQLILGGNMSSRLFQVIREQLGLAYSIFSFLSFFHDTGLLGISAGVSPAKLEALLDAVAPELKGLKEAAVPEAEVQAARDYLRGSIYLGAEDVDHMMMRLARNEIHFGHYIPLEEIVAGLMRVSAAEIQELARELFRPEKWAATLMGPVAPGFSGALDF